MNEQIRDLMEAHVAHELDRFKEENFRKAVAAEVDAFFDWSAAIRLRDAADSERILAIVKRSVVEIQFDPEAAHLVGEWIRVVLDLPENRTTPVKEVVARGPYAEAVQKIATLEGARKRLIRRFVVSRVYSRQIADVLYAGIRDFLMEENLITRKIPGMASLIKFGRLAVNKTMPPLESLIEATVKRYIEINLTRMLRRSERSLNDYFTADRIINAGNRMWESAENRPLCEYADRIDPGQTEEFRRLGKDFWRHFRQTPFFEAVCRGLAGYVFAEYGDRKLNEIWQAAGITPELVTDNILDALTPAIETGLATGFLAARIRARLESFYLSDAAGQALSEKPAVETGQQKKGRKRKINEG